jgi:hypothetical protein
MVVIISFIVESINSFSVNKVVCYKLLYKLFVISYLVVIPSVRKLLIIRFALILSLVRRYVTNNNGFWIGWFDLLTPSFTISLN